MLTFLSGQQQRLDVCNPVHAVIHFHLLKAAVDVYLTFLHVGLLKKHIRDFLKKGLSHSLFWVMYVNYYVN